MPSMEVPAAGCLRYLPGCGPEDIEQQVTKKLEGAVAGLSGLDTLQSTSSENMAMLVIRFTNDTDMDQAMTDLRDKVSQVKSQLPDDASDPTVMSIDIDSMPVVQVALRGSDLAALQSIAEDEISPALERLDGVASVDVRAATRTRSRSRPTPHASRATTSPLPRSHSSSARTTWPSRARPRQRFADACRPHGRRVFLTQ